MTTIKARLNCSRLGSDGTYPLVIRIIHERVKREVYTSYRLRPEEFEVCSEKAITKSRVKEKVSYIREVNECINYIKEELKGIRDSLECRGEYTTPEIVHAYKNRNDMGCFFTYAGGRINELMILGREGTAANYRSAINAFEHYLGNSDLSMNDLTPKMIEAFIDSQTRQGNSPNTAAFYVKQLRAIYNKAYDEGYIRSAHNPFHRIKLKGCKTPKRAITKKEINRICRVNLDGRHRHLELSRDLFMFSLYTRGMAFVDMCYLKKENIHGNMLVYRRRKTGQWLQIRIEAPLKELLRKYYNAESQYLLPMLRGGDSYKDYRYIQRRLNKRIREIGDLLEFNFPLTFYVARHTWATLAHESGVAMSVISEGMGHGSEKTTRIYLAGLSHQVIDKANRAVINSWRL
ncbi:site-specific integrase [Bacteroides nordii]|uniref:Site-specific integrase n=2 Tax=Bacteroides nordii TaxID=291645 RepID=A0A413VIH6_9BACE|nr:site-specific integrase [Bacteroides nordii]RHB33376.1 site-specific integrase [Bacteroides nordii]